MIYWVENDLQISAQLDKKICFAIVTDETVKTLYGENLKKTLDTSFKVSLFSFPAGEKNKNRKTKELIEDQMFAQNFSKDSCLIALGGGVVTDVAGFIAATFCRGISLINIPTTLLGMVDASIGGKTGLNVTQGKNFLGCLYPANQIFMNLAYLNSLPRKDLCCGLIEMIKHGLIADPSYFNFLEEQIENLIKLERISLKEAIEKSIKIKMQIVGEDQRDIGKRKILNFGHTIGHALETLSNYSITHGEAVAFGLLVESYMCLQLGYLKKNSFERIFSIIMKVLNPFYLLEFEHDLLLKILVSDKKSLKGCPRFVMIDEIGSALFFEGAYCQSVDQNLIKKALFWIQDALHSHSWS